MKTSAITNTLNRLKITPLGRSTENLAKLQEADPRTFNLIMRYIQKRKPRVIRVPNEMADLHNYQQMLAEGIETVMERAMVAGGRLLDLAFIPTDSDLAAKEEIVERNELLRKEEEKVCEVIREFKEKLRANLGAPQEKQKALIGDINKKLAERGSPYLAPKDEILGLLRIYSILKGVYSVGEIFMLNSVSEINTELPYLQLNNVRDCAKLITALLSRTTFGDIPKGLYVSKFSKELGWVKEINARWQVLFDRGEIDGFQGSDNVKVTAVANIEELRAALVASEYKNFDFAFWSRFETIFANFHENSISYINKIVPSILHTLLEFVLPWGVFIHDGEFNESGCIMFSVARVPFLISEFSAHFSEHLYFYLRIPTNSSD